MVEKIKVFSEMGNCRKTTKGSWVQKFDFGLGKFEMPFRYPSGYMNLKFKGEVSSKGMF